MHVTSSIFKYTNFFLDKIDYSTAIRLKNYQVLLLLAFIGDRGVHILDIRLDETGGGIGTGTTTE